MPNWCENDLIIMGGKNALKDFMNEVGNDGSCFDFDKIIPMPKELKIQSGGLTNKGLAVFLAEKDKDYKEIDKLNSYEWAKDKTREELIAEFKEDKIAMKLGEQAYKNLKKHECADWYEWSIKYWGTKWNSSDAEIIKRTSKSVHIRFMTAWSPPLPVITIASEKYPYLKFSIRYYEMGCGFEGHLIIKAGKTIQHKTNDNYKGNRGG